MEKNKDIPHPPRPFVGRSMFSDIASTTSANDPKIARTILDEAEAHEIEHEARSPGSRSNLVFIIGSVALLAVAVVIIGWVMSKSASVPITMDNNERVPSLLYAERHEGFDVNRIAPFEITEGIATLRNQEAEADTITHVYFGLPVTNDIQRITTNQLLDALEAGAPTDLVDVLGDTFMFGVYYVPEGGEAFLVMTVDNFTRAFAGMRTWESELPYDMAELLGIANQNQFINQMFEDRIIANQTVRMITGAAGDTIMYSFLRENVLVIASDAQSISEIAERLANRALVQ